MPSADEKQDKAFLARVEDLFSVATKKYQPRFSAFLDLHQQKLVKQATRAHSENSWMLYGGYAGAERMMLGIFPPYEPLSEALFPMVSMTIIFRKEDEIGHRDLLGAILALGIKRETIGDILVETGQAVCFLTEPAARMVEQELCKVGRCGVKPVRGQPQILPAMHEYISCEVQVSSLRLDCIIAALCKLSREKSAQMIRSRLVQVDSVGVDEISFCVVEGMVLSLRGYGKFLFEKVERTTRSGRLAVIFQKYA